MYHFSMFHASHHIAPVPATEEEVLIPLAQVFKFPSFTLTRTQLSLMHNPLDLQIEVEAGAVKAVAEDVCPLNIILDRVVLTSTGVLVGCWQVLF